MSVSQYQSQVNSLDKEISQLEIKRARKDEECAKIENKILTIEKSITKSTSLSTIKTKTNEIGRLKNDLVKKRKESSDLGNKIADKRKKRQSSYLNLQKAEKEESKKKEQEVKKRYKIVQTDYEKRIQELEDQLLSDQITKLSNGENRIEAEEYDVFISHASEDKESFVDEFVEELNKLDIKVWYDKTNMRWGNSLRAHIDSGLAKSTYGIVVISKDYIAPHKYWTKAELDGLFDKESIYGERILPIWHNITKKEVSEYSPLLASKLAMSTALYTPEEIAKELKNLLLQAEEENHGQTENAQ